MLPSLADLKKKYPGFITVIHRKLKSIEAQNFCEIVTKAYTRIRISVYADKHREENSDGSYILEEIGNRFDYIVREVLRCPLITELQRRVYVNKQREELIEQNQLLFEAKFSHEVGVTKHKNHNKVVQVCYLVCTYFIMNSKNIPKL